MRENLLNQHTIDHEEIFINRELIKKLNDIIDHLPEKCRIIFNLSRIESFKYKEISTKQGVSVKTVERQISFALAKLRTALTVF